MSSNAETRAAARTRAQSHFEAAAQRDATVFAQLEKERSVTESKTAKLKALRLAKEEEDRAEEARIAAEKPEPKPAKRKRKAAVKPRRVSVSV